MKLPNCDFCKRKQKELGALLFSAPIVKADAVSCCMKFHVCIKCYELINKLKRHIQNKLHPKKKKRK